MDSVIMALFFPAAHREFYVNRVLTVQPRREGVNPETWEARATSTWRRNVLHSLSIDVQRLVQTPSPSQGWPLDAFRYLLSAVPYSVDGGAINFGHPGQQSAVDFLRYLFTIAETRDSLVTFQTSVTFFEARSDVDAALETPDPIATLLDMWTSSAKSGDFTRDNVDTLPDEDERQSLATDRSGLASFAINSYGDRRRISGEQSMSLILCPLTAEDTQVQIDRELLPRLDSPADGYTGTVAVTMSALRLLAAPVLIFEVTRRVYTAQGEHVKSVAHVHYGAVQENGEVWLLVQGVVYSLQAVVCHFGSSTSGHYVAFVQHQAGEWYVYDDAMTPQLKRLESAAAMEAVGSPSRSGELFFYVPVVE
jgi:hypothetical protein